MIPLATRAVRERRRLTIESRKDGVGCLCLGMYPAWRDCDKQRFGWRGDRYAFRMESDFQRSFRAALEVQRLTQDADLNLQIVGQ